MRVLILAWEYPPHVVGGLGKHVMELAPALVNVGVEVYVLTPRLRGGEASETTPDGVHVFRPDVPMSSGSLVEQTDVANLALVEAARTLIMETGGFDLLHVHDWLTASSGETLKREWGLPLVATIHATERGRWQGSVWNGQTEQINAMEWQLTYEAWRVITCSQFMARQVNEYFNTPLDKIDVIPNGVEIYPSTFATLNERQAFRQRYAADGEPLAYYVGRVVYEKGLQVLLAAWPQVLVAYPKARLVIAGTGGYLEALKVSASALGLSDSVLFAGFVSDEDRDRLYHVADVAVFPSLYEPFGIVALEAMAAHCPVVVAQTGGLTEVVRLHETGILVHPNDPMSLAWGITHTLEHPTWSRERANNAFVEARDVFNWQAIAKATALVYAQACEERQSIADTQQADG